MSNLTKEIWLVAFFLSKYGNTQEGKETSPPIELKTLKWKDAYCLFYNRFGDSKTIKSFANSLKNCRDAFDGHIENSTRNGWRELNRKPIKLPQLAKSIFNKYNSVSRENIWDEIKLFIIEKKIDLISLTNMNEKKKNPDWNREELILALDLYFRMDYGQMHGRNPEIIQLSKDLRNLSFHLDVSNEDSFRSVNSVSLKLANLKKSDQNFKGKGMRDGGRLEKELWNEFHGHRDKLKKEADLIRTLYLKKEDKLEAKETKVNYKSEFIFKFHENRERDPLFEKVKKEMVFTNTKSLKCEVCGFDSAFFYGELGKDIMEIHYCKEWKDEPVLESSSMEDFIIVCSNCHKVLHKNYFYLGAEDLKTIIRKKK
ncbi:MAG: hypothetical protein HY951_02655 [Bacteroidia bacterium]|nr:hypothetical protein [Bacteroidia bacterium]